MNKLINHTWFVLPLFLCIGCSGESPIPSADAFDSNISLPIASLNQGISTRAAIDEWNATPISVAYRFEPNLIYAGKLDVTIPDNTGVHLLDTGLDYPSTGGGDDKVYLRGFYPQAVPDATTGIVEYDIKEGNVDVMLSDPVSGSKNDPLSGVAPDVMQFKHLLTRFKFTFKCQPGSNYPNRIAGVFITPKAVTAPIAGVQVDLQTGLPRFINPGAIYCTFEDGSIEVPSGGTPAAILDVMIRPNTSFNLGIVNDDDEMSVTTVTIPAGGAGSVNDIVNNTGGVQGVCYTIELLFSGAAISSGSITAHAWDGGALDITNLNQLNDNNFWH
ncbi:MAG: fimbrillin family protein [Prevotellaceae bacterium]|jgi:hypothetical protein|nr:fimbrillin family protein [Prevotellaceae bacterium]